MEEIYDKELGKLLEMQEHPENYSDEEIEAMLDSDDFRLLSEVKRAMAYRFSEKRVASSEKRATQQPASANHYSLHTTHYTLKKLAAIFIGAVLLGGIAYAAIRIATERTPMPIAENDNEGAVKAKAATIDEVTDGTKTIATDSIVKFEDAELETVVKTMAAHYGVETRFDNEAAKHIHIFLVWNKNCHLEDIIAVLNGYDRINVSLDDKTLIVK